MCTERETVSENLHLKILGKTAELLSIETPDSTPVGRDRLAAILDTHREIRDLMKDSSHEIGEPVEVESI